MKCKLPPIGSEWNWEPGTPHWQQVRVIAYDWDGYEWRIESELLNGGARHWNTLDRWIEACTPIEGGS